MFSMSASSGRVHNLQPCGVGIVALPNLTNNGHINITDAFILSDSSASMVWLCNLAQFILMLDSLLKISYCHHRSSSILRAFFTSLLMGTLCMMTSWSVSRDAGISFIIVFLLATGLIVPFSAFHQFMISWDIRNDEVNKCLNDEVNK